jgi:hypothetical protein
MLPLRRHPTGTPEQLRVRGMSAYVGRAFDAVVEEEIAELEALGDEDATSDASAECEAVGDGFTERDALGEGKTSPTSRTTGPVNAWSKRSEKAGWKF